MNEKQQEIINLLIDSLQNLKLNDLKYRKKIEQAFNILSSEDHEWFQIEQSLYQIINNLEKIK